MIFDLNVLRYLDKIIGVTFHFTEMRYSGKQLNITK